MTPVESAALERLISAVKNSLLVRAASAKTRDSIEADVRRIAAGGMTMSDARHIADAIDTKAERDRARAMVPPEVSAEDRATLLRWLENEVLRVLATTAAAPSGQSRDGGAVAPHATTFLRSNARVTSHVLLSEALTDAQRAELIEYNRAQGYGVMYLYCANEGDYGGRAVSYRQEKRAAWRKWLQAVIDSGARVIMWGCADDSPGLANRTVDQWREYWGMIHSDCGDLVSEWVVGLECDERWSAGTTQALTRLLKDITGKPVGVHTTGLSKIGHAAGADAFYLQTGFGKSPAQVTAAVRDAKSRFGGRVICAEYSKDGDTAAAKAIGDAAIAAGADGVGNGCTPAGLAMLRKTMAGGAPNGGDPSPLIDVGASHGLTFRYIGGGLKDVAWSPSVDRSLWPSKPVKGKPCNGRLHGCREGEPMRAIEWIKVGSDSAHTVNAWAAVGTEYGQAFKKGNRCRFEIRDINDKPRGSFAGGCALG